MFCSMQLSISSRKRASIPFDDVRGEDKPWGYPKAAEGSVRESIRRVAIMAEYVVALNKPALLVPSFEIASTFNPCLKNLPLPDWRNLFLFCTLV